MPLLAPACIKDGERRRRVEVLHDTIDKFVLAGDRYESLAQQNMARWASEKPNETSQTLLVIQGDMLECTGMLTRKHGTPFVCLNMANAHYPGGGYTLGCAAQEENMFRRTDVHFSLDSTNIIKEGRDVVYTDSMSELVSGKQGVNYISTNQLVCIKGKEEYSEPDFGYKLLSDDEIFSFFELRSAAVNVSVRKKKPADLDILMAERIDAQFAALISRGFRHVVLSAFGCGAFGNDPHMVAWLYRKALVRHKADFDVVAFAIFYAGHGERNYDIFKDVLSDVWTGTR